ncbi:chemotaxis protein CheA [Massilia sp. CFBP9012]|uniref:chemotaxis protein CheA n=1 Tax=Massilia sp. CFBP9012 TaxID=3096531 RepID=UPI002A6B3531|nr:chemotaxis protein CheA [Massilia sp. CFBP9012]MDY0975965.1 chemotaxis protein CheA [Massilia sp. CFBP9012]
MSMEQALQTFTAECRELLHEMEDALLAGCKGKMSADSINAVFRAAHTIKGSAGLFGLDHIVGFTHVAESVLDAVRAGQLDFTPSLVELMLACRDHMAHLVDAVAAGQLDEDPALAVAGLPLRQRLSAYLDADPAATAAAAAAAAPAAPATDIDVVPGGGHWHISLRFGSEVLRNGMDPMSFLRYLATLGAVAHVAPVLEAVPPLGELDAEACYLGLEIALHSDASREAIEGAFEFVRDDCRLRIVAPGSTPAAYRALADEFPEQRAMMVALLQECGSWPAADAQAPAVLAPCADPVADPAANLDAAEGARPRRSQEKNSVRVDADKLDHLINLVGELIVATAGANLAARRAQNVELQEYGATLNSLVEDVRNSALQLRMVKIGSTFTRFKRVVHDVARDLGKDIELAIDGEDTELDKTVVEKIADPLTHLVRNAIDHGIEPAALRRERGKPEHGTIWLNAYHDSGTVVIEVGDDGGGLQRERLLAKAIERGIVEEGRHLSDAEVYALIFEPGFSTAEQVTNLSGRGVGMDVVKRNITALRGTIQIDSTPGVGTTMRVRLPLTLAIIDGFQVAVGGSVFVVPLEMVEECVEFRSDETQDYANLRGTVLPFIRLRELFALDGAASSRQSLVVVRYAGQRAGLVVDGLLGESQTVIKPLGKVFRHMRCISGSSILGSGDVALILDVPSLIHQAGAENARLAQPVESAAA